MSEHDEQVALFQFLVVHESRHPELKMVFAIPNGGHRHIATARKMKAEGVRPGVLDICVPCPRGGFTGLWVEMKFGKNKLSPQQEEWREMMLREGWQVVVCYDWAAAAKNVFAYFGINWRL